MKKTYYRLNYFFSRKDSGSVFVSFTKEELDGIDDPLIDEDDIIEVALKLGKLSPDMVSNIVEVERMDDEEVAELELEKRGI